jgi:hypothetical protein
VRGKNASAFAVAAGISAHWIIETDPIPINAYKDFDTVPVEPRNTFRLESAPADNSVFTVGLQFLPSNSAVKSLKAISTANAEGFSTGAGQETVTALFRTKPGNLSHNGFDTNGDVLAVVGERNSEHLFAARARSFDANGRAILSSNAPVDAEITMESKEDDLWLFASGPAIVNIQVRSQVRSVSLDGTVINIQKNGDSIGLNLNKGEHSVHISY